MNVELIIEADNIRAAVAKTAEEILAHCVNNMGLDVSVIECLYVVDDSSFGKTITTLQESLGQRQSFTDNQFLKAVAKVIRHKDKIPITNSIVIKEIFFLPFMAGSDGMFQYDEEKAEFDFYVIQHEFAHCIDNVKRKPSLEVSEELPFSYENLAKANCGTLEDESCACFLSGKAMVPRVFQNEIKAAGETYRDIIDSCNEYKRLYGNDNSKLFDLACQVAYGIWAIMIQYSKLIAGKLGNPNLKDINIKFPSGTYWLYGRPAFLKLERVIRDMLTDYPARVGSCRQELKNIWYEIALSAGYKLVESDKGIGIYFDM